MEANGDSLTRGKPKKGWLIPAILAVALVGASFAWFKERTHAQKLSREISFLESEVASHDTELAEKDSRISELELQLLKLEQKSRDLIDASLRLRSNADRFSYDNWRDVVPDVDSGADDVSDAAEDLERELP